MQNVPRVFLFGALFTAVLLEAGVIYFLDDPSLRLYVGLTLLVPIAWMFARSEVAEVISDLPISLKKRQYSKMRAQVILLLAEIRRLNWMAVDADRGFRGRDEAMAEMDTIESRMRVLISEIRREAGRASHGLAGRASDELAGRTSDEMAGRPSDELQTVPVPDEISQRVQVPDETSQSDE